MSAPQVIRIAGRMVGAGHPCFTIAEAGSNHNGSLETALELIDAAAQAGADAVKFQTFRASEHYVRNTPQFSYLKKNFPGKSTYDLIRENELPREWHKTLRERAREKGILFLSTPSDRPAVDELVEEHQMAAIKIASFETVDLPFIEYCALKRKPLIIATGMCNLGEIEDVLSLLRRCGNEDAVFLHAVSLYPARPDQMNLRAMRTMAAAFGVPVGLSDHTMGIDIPLAAVALGACVIEKHFTLDRKLPGPDHSFAIEPAELQAMVKGIRNVETALGSGRKQMHPDEEEMARLGRRSVVARRAIPQGTLIQADMLTTKRPGYGIRPMHLPLLIHRVARVSIQEDEVITWDMV